MGKFKLSRRQQESRNMYRVIRNKSGRNAQEYGTDNILAVFDSFM